MDLNAHPTLMSHAFCRPYLIDETSVFDRSHVSFGRWTYAPLGSRACRDLLTKYISTEQPRDQRLDGAGPDSIPLFIIRFVLHRKYPRYLHNTHSCLHYTLRHRTSQSQHSSTINHRISLYVHVIYPPHALKCRAAGE